MKIPQDKLLHIYELFQNSSKKLEDLTHLPQILNMEMIQEQYDCDHGTHISFSIHRFQNIPIRARYGPCFEPFQN